MKSIGVVIPCKNYAHFIADALRSLAIQDMLLRVVIVDDGGSDGQMLDSIASAFSSRDLTIDVIHMPSSRGIGLARNTGAAYLSTDYFLFLDADDWLHPFALEALVFELDATRADFAYGNYTQGEKIVATPAWDGNVLHMQNIASYCNLWRRESFWQIGGYSNIAVAEDWELQKRAHRAGLVPARVNALIFEHRLHDKNKWAADALNYGGMVGVAGVLANYGE